MEILNLSLSELSSAIKNKKTSAVEVTSFYLDRIKKLNSEINAVVEVNEKALDQAKQIDEKLEKGMVVGSLLGVPVGIKDMICTKNIRTTACSKMLENFIPPYDATLVAKLKKEGAIVLCKLNQDEFAMGSSNETSYFGTTKNPWNLKYVTGGSSGGSAAAMAAKLVPATIGTDTGGSIRQPASFCGVVGVKPTYGRVSRYGIIAYASSLDQAGPITASVKDAAQILQTISGHDQFDSTCSKQLVPNWLSGITENIKGMKVGILKEFLTDSLHPDVLKSVNEARKLLESLGAQVVEVSVPLAKHGVPTYYLIATSEASSNLARYDGIKYGHRTQTDQPASVDLNQFYSDTRAEGFGDEVKKRIMLGTYCLSSGYYDAYYNKAGQVRRLIRDQFIEVFHKCDVILSPVTTAPAFKIGEKISDPISMYLNDIFTTCANLAGLPGMSVPYSLSGENLPIGIQLIANHFQESKMLNIAYAIEQNAPVKGLKPNVI